MISSMKGLSLGVVAMLTWGCASGAGVRREPRVSARGAVVAERRPVQALLRGPAVIHAHAQDAGSTLFLSPALTGGDADCDQVAARSGLTPVLADRRVTLEVPAGSVACATLTGRPGGELLWHAHAVLEDAAPSPALASRDE